MKPTPDITSSEVLHTLEETLKWFNRLSRHDESFPRELVDQIKKVIVKAKGIK